MYGHFVRGPIQSHKCGVDLALQVQRLVSPPKILEADGDMALNAEEVTLVVLPIAV